MRRIALLALVGVLAPSSVSRDAHAMSEGDSTLLLVSIGALGTVDSVLLWADAIMAIGGHQPSRRYYGVEVGLTAPQIPFFCVLAASANGSAAIWYLALFPVVPMVHGIWGLIRTPSPSTSPPSSEPDYPGVLGSGAGTDGLRDSSTGRRAKDLSLSWSPTVVMTGREATPGLAVFGRF
jgi:hypothetical protein